MDRLERERAREGASGLSRSIREGGGAEAFIERRLLLLSTVQGLCQSGLTSTSLIVSEKRTWAPATAPRDGDGWTACLFNEPPDFLFSFFFFQAAQSGGEATCLEGE